MRHWAVQSLLRWDSLGLTNATVSVDTFFVMSGFLACFLLLRELDRCVVNGSVRWDMVGGKTLLSYVHRYLRYTSRWDGKRKIGIDGNFLFLFIFYFLEID